MKARTGRVFIAEERRKLRNGRWSKWAPVFPTVSWDTGSLKRGFWKGFLGQAARQKGVEHRVVEYVPRRIESAALVSTPTGTMAAPFSGDVEGVLKL